MITETKKKHTFDNVQHFVLICLCYKLVFGHKKQFLHDTENKMITGNNDSKCEVVQVLQTLYTNTERLFTLPSTPLSSTQFSLFEIPMCFCFVFYNELNPMAY